MNINNAKNIVKTIAKSKVARATLGVIVTVIAVLSVPAFAYLDINPANWGVADRGFGMAFAATLSGLVVLMLTNK